MQIWISVVVEVTCRDGSREVTGVEMRCRCEAADAVAQQEFLAVDDIGLEDIVLDGGGLERMVKFYRLPDAPDVTRITHSLEVPLLDAGDTPIFVRVTQVDGHKAWSSPVYLFR